MNRVLALQGRSHYRNGFTINEGTVVALAAAAFGGGASNNVENILTLHGGTIAAGTNLTMVAHGGGGGFITGDIQIGALSNNYAANAQYLINDNANIAFDDTFSLGGAVRTLKIGGNGNYTFNGTISNGGLTVDLASGATGKFIFSTNNTYAGATTITAGTLDLNAASGQALGGTAAVTIGSGGTLLLSQSNQVNDLAAITLAGGTIRRNGDVSEAFGDLNLTAPSFLDYGSGASGTLTFGDYTPGYLLTVTNFAVGDTLVFKTNLSSSISDTNFFVFDNGITSNWDGSLFTVTAVPEPHVSVLLVMTGLGLAGFCARKRLSRRPLASKDLKA